MLKRKKKSVDGHRSFRVLGLLCTQSDMTTSYAPPYKFYLYVPGMRMGAKRIGLIRLAALKYRLGFKKWYK